MASPTPLTAKPNINQDAVLTFPAVSGTQTKLNWVRWLYEKEPTGSPTLTVESPLGTVLKTQTITKSGAGHLAFLDDAIRGAAGQDVYVILGAGGDGVQGSVTALQSAY